MNNYCYCYFLLNLKVQNIKEVYSSITWNSYENFKTDLNFKFLIEENISYRKMAFSSRRFYVSNIYKWVAKMTWLLELPEFSFWTKIKIQVFEFKGRHCNVSWPYMRFTPYMMIFTYAHHIISSSAHWLSITVKKLLQKPFLKK